MGTTTTSTTAIASEDFPLEADPQIDDRGRGWVDLKLTREGADELAEHIIRRLRADHHALARVHAAATATGPAVHPVPLRALSDILLRHEHQLTPQTCEDLGRELVDAADVATDPHHVEAATATLTELVTA